MKQKAKKPELTSPAGDWCSLHTAIEAGADSIYFGVKGLNMRNLALNFDLLEIKKVVKVLHQHKKRAYLALNVIVYNNEIDKIKKILSEAKKSKIDGVILWDMAVFSLAKKMGLKVHLSTQASVSNFLALKKYAALGVKRAVLARECSLNDIKQIAKKIKKAKLNCQLEAFIHGAMCVSISGRCFLSEYSFAKSANRGECLQPCRRKFLITDLEKESEYILGQDYLLSPKDLCTIDFIDQLIQAGVDAFKIEGRNRSPEYVRVVTSVYRRAIEAYFSNQLTDQLKKQLKAELSCVYNRGFSSGFYLGRPKDWKARRLEHSHEKVYVGEVLKFYKQIKVAELWVRDHSLKKGDDIVCLGKNTPANFATVSDIQINHSFVDQLKKGEKGGIKLPFILKPGDKVFLWKKK
ncbi:MAG: U32 family peptidase [Candidatus Omnitrophica bacterium]|nr:U32 family peptidase [Candidatus Omnitrophota bacterium]MBU2265754.1 U32 family peptidase [Candidatus Omnitrophota bacterium]